MSERRAKQARRLLRLSATGSPERATPRLPKHAPDPSLVGWNDAGRRQHLHRDQENARRHRQRFGVLAGVSFYGAES